MYYNFILFFAVEKEGMVDKRGKIDNEGLDVFIWQEG